MKSKADTLIPLQAKSAVLAIWQDALAEGFDPAAVMTAVIEEARSIIAGAQSKARVESKIQTQVTK